MCMKKSILLALLCAFVFVGCESNNIQCDTPIGHTFAIDNDKRVLSLTFNKDLSAEYHWKNTWEKDINSRTDLYYEIKSNTEFTIFTDNDSTIWGDGVFNNDNRPYILLSNFSLDTLYLKK